MFSDIFYLSLAQSLPSPQSGNSHFYTLGEKWVSLALSPTAEEARPSLIILYFFLQKWSLVSSFSKLCHTMRRGDPGKFLLIHSNASKLFALLSAGISPLEISTSTNAVMLMNIYPSQCFFRWYCWKGLEIIHRILPVPQPMTRFINPIPQHTGGKYYSWVPWPMVLHPTAPTAALLFVDSCQILDVRKSQKQGMAYAALMVMSLRTFFIIIYIL